MAREDLERVKVAQLLGIVLSKYHGRVDDISLDEDDHAVTFLVRSKEDQKAFMRNLRKEIEEYGSTKAAETERYYLESESEAVFPRPEKTVELRSDDIQNALSIGNTTILEWGRLVPEAPAFNTATKLYPLGLKCIRYEYDALSHSVVQCMCEIISDREDHSELSTPLFRVTVSWTLTVGGAKKIENKVYEGTNPRQVWDAIAVETIGGGTSSAPTIIKSEPTSVGSIEDELMKELVAKRRSKLVRRKEAILDSIPNRVCRWARMTISLIHSVSAFLKVLRTTICKNIHSS